MYTHNIIVYYVVLYYTTLYSKCHAVGSFGASLFGTCSLLLLLLMFILLLLLLLV